MKEKKKGFVMSTAVYMIITLSSILIMGTLLIVNSGNANQTARYKELYDELNSDIYFDYSG